CTQYFDHRDRGSEKGKVIGTDADSAPAYRRQLGMKKSQSLKRSTRSRRAAWISAWFMASAGWIALSQAEQGSPAPAAAQTRTPAAVTEPVLKAMGDELD